VEIRRIICDFLMASAIVLLFDPLSGNQEARAEQFTATKPLALDTKLRAGD
jgi:hypothetical protein